jgi:hypothetical protein
MRIGPGPERGRTVRRVCRTATLLAGLAVPTAACQVAVGDERVSLPPADVRIVQPAQVSVPPGHLPPPGPCGCLQVRVPPGAVLVRG